jgi:hypothetical protein
MCYKKNKKKETRENRSKLSMGQGEIKMGDAVVSKAKETQL